MRAAGGVTFPTDSILWCNGIDTSVFGAQRNPRLRPNLAELAALPLASIVGENDNEIYAPVVLPWVYSSHDTARKWPRMLAAATGGTNGAVYIRRTTPPARMLAWTMTAIPTPPISSCSATA
jgi:hypothetical protein